MAEYVSKDLNDIDWNEFQNNFDEQEAEILSLKSFYENTGLIEILEEANNSDKTLNSLKIQIKISTKIKKIKILIPQENCDAKQINVGRETRALQRSISGYHSFTDITCELLPPLFLRVVLPPTYPSDSCPYFALSSFWLNREQLSDACRELEKLWDLNKPMIILYTWVEWLQESLVDFLSLREDCNEEIILRPEINITNDDKIDSRAISEFTDIQNCIYQILSYNFVEEINIFRQSIQTCSLCYDEKLGKDFFRINNCKHVFCAQCIGEYSKIYVKEGTIQLLKCPERGCDEKLGDDIMQAVLDDTEYERWDRLTFQLALDSMQDIMYCPQCSNPIVVDENDTHLICLSCKTDFCKECKEKWHQGPCLTVEQKAQKVVQNLNLNHELFLEMTDEEITKTFNQNSAFLITLKKKLDEKKTFDETFGILTKYKKCPTCKSLIEKSEGCNKVTCRCGTIICYICGRQINGYDHFGKGCDLWSNNVAARIPEREIHPAQRAINRIINAVPEQQQNIMRCPSCGQNCLRMGQNNHLKCWLCQTNFCFMCKKRIVGIITYHYKAGSTCKQHS